MQVSLQRQPIENVEAEAVILPVFEEYKDARLGLGELYHSGEIVGKPYEMTLLHNVAGPRAKRLLAVGAGKPGKFGPAEMRRVAGAAIRHLQARSITQAALFLDAAYIGADYAAAAVEGAILGEFEPDRYKTDKKGSKRLERFTVVVAEGGPHLDAAVARAEFRTRAGQRAGQ
jgi:leucyl aminopeptidase